MNCFWGISAFLLLSMLSALPVFAGEDQPETGGFQALLDEHGIELHVSIEFDYQTEEGFDNTEGSSSTAYNSDASLDVEIGYQPCDWFDGEMVISWDDETPMEIDEGFVTIGSTQDFTPFLSAGKLTTPFGLFETRLISDPLTQEIGELKTYALVLGAEWEGFYADTFIYDGSTVDGDDNGKDLKVFGAGGGYLYEGDGIVFLAGGSWIENIADADNFSDFLDEEVFSLTDRTPGAAIYALLEYGPLTFGIEYVAALEHIEVDEEDETIDLGRSETWATEISYSTEIVETEVVVAFSYGETDSLAYMLPEKRIGGGVSIAPLPYLKLACEYLREYDYPTSKEGTGDKANIVTFQLAMEY